MVYVTGHSMQMYLGDKDLHQDANKNFESISILLNSYWDIPHIVYDELLDRYKKITTNV